MTPKMRLIMQLQTLAGDTRISDYRFRRIFFELNRYAFNRKMIKERLDILREQAIMETERDLHVYGQSPSTFVTA